MARPCCPLCQDAFSVARVSAIARSDLLPLAARWQPPAAPGALGRYLLMALIGAAVLYVLTGPTLLCPALVPLAAVARSPWLHRRLWPPVIRLGLLSSAVYWGI